MSRFEEIQKKLDELSPIPVNMPKFYLLGDTGAGKTTIVRKILGTDRYKFPSVQQKRTTVAVTEYVLSRDIPFKASYIFKTETQINELIKEILEVAIEKAYSTDCKGELDTEEIIENLEETPDERFRLRYILTVEELEQVAKTISDSLLPKLHSSIDALKIELDSNEEDIGVIVDLALENIKNDFSEIQRHIISLISKKVSEMCNGHELFSATDYYQHSEQKLDEFITQAKKLLSSAKKSISPVIEYARLEGNLLAEWLPDNTELVLIDGEGIGHDTREASRLSARHLDYFHFSDSIGLVEESKKPFASGGKSAMEGIIRNGYLDKFKLIFSKLDEVEVGDEEDTDRDEQIRAVKKGFRNVKNALKDDGIESNIGSEHLYYLSNMKDKESHPDSVLEIGRLIAGIKSKFEEDVPQFIVPIYDYEMLSSYLVKSSDNFITKWNSMLNSKHWQTVKAFNRRMCWEWDEFRDMKPISDFHNEVTKELESFISSPSNWVDSATPSMQSKSIDRVKQEFSNSLLSFSRMVILQTYSDEWEKAMLLSGAGSTIIRRSKIKNIIQETLPDHKKPEAIKLKDSIKQLLVQSVEACKA
jgi:adenylate kinase family enzyme